MGSKYRNVKAIGQEYKNSCWAASLAWWLKATNKRNIEEWEILDDDEYSDLWDTPTGSTTISEEGLLKVMKDARWGMTHQKIENGSDLTGAVLAAHLNFGPVYIGYQDVVVGGGHVNVIYGMDGPWEYPRVYAMEPAYKKRKDGTFKGAHVDRGLSYYRGRKVILASPAYKITT